MSEKEHKKEDSFVDIAAYYGKELIDFHLPGQEEGNAVNGSGSLAGRIGQAAAAAQNTSNTLGGQIIGGAGVALGLIGEVMSLPMQIADAVLIPVMSQLKFLQGIACLPMAKQLDPVVGLDVHMVNIPPNPAPTPMPHIYVATVFDPKDWKSCAIMAAVAAIAPAGPDPADAGTPEGDMDAAINLAFNAGVMAGSIRMGKKGMNATVSSGLFVPRAIAGSANRAIVHVPMGAGFHPTFAHVKKHRGHLFLGSLFVSTDMEALGCMGFLNNNCWDVGMPELKRINSGPSPGELYLPTGAVIAIPWNGVQVNPVPTPMNPAGYIMGKVMAGFAKLKKGFANGVQGIAGKIMKKKGWSQARMDAVHKKICDVLGHPVDVASGELFTDEEDFSLPGPIPLSFERTWYSRSDYEGPLGYGWHHSYDMALCIDRESDGAIFRMEDGRIAGFRLPSHPESPTYNRTEKLHLHLHEEGFYYITNADHLILRFTERKYAPQSQGLDVQLLQSISNRKGFAILFDYNPKGWLTQITDSAGRELKIRNDAKGRITEITAPHPNYFNETICIAAYEYDALGNLVRQTNAMGDSMVFSYSHHLLTEEVWRNGSKWYFRWDGTRTGSKCIETWGDGNLYHYRIEYQEGLTRAVNGEGVKTSHYHKNGLVYNRIDGKGNSWQKRFNRYNELELERDPLGNETLYCHDDKGNIATIHYPGGGFEYREYYDPDLPHALMEAMDPNGGKWQFAYDDAGSLVKRINPNGAILEVEYEDGLPVSIKDEAGGRTGLGFDKDYNLCRVTEPLGAIWEYRHDRLGRSTEEVNPSGLRRRLKFDRINRVTEIKDFDGNHIRLEYDGIDNILRYKDNQKEVHYTYQGLWKMTSRSEAGHTLRFSYNSEEQLTRLINEHGLPYRFHLDANGNTVREIGFDGLTREYTRNEAGWVTANKRPSGTMTKYQHDEAGRVTEVQYHTGEFESYDYFPSGLLKTAANATATVEYKRDKLGNVIQENCNGETIISTYDQAGRRTGLSSSLGADIQYDLDALGNSVSILASQDNTIWQANSRYDALGLEIERMLPGGLSSQWKRDQLGRPVEQVLGQGGSTKHRRRYTWGINDRLNEIIDSATGSAKFTHDGRGYLTGATYSDGTVQHRNPDAVGNLFERLDRKDRQYGRGGRLLKKGSTRYEYDLEGNLIKKLTPKGVWYYHWNAAGMLEKVVRPDKEEVTFAYDALGRRLFKKLKRTITNFVWDGNVPLHEFKTFDFKEGKVGQLITWVFENDGFIPAGKIKNGKEYSIETDHLGTPHRLYDGKGEMVWLSELDAYGRQRTVRGESGTCPFRYQGQYQDRETGLYYNRFRYYDAEDGRYISQDPIRLASEEGNFYFYVQDTSIQIDHFGLTYKKGGGKNSKHSNQKAREAAKKKYDEAKLELEKLTAIHPRTKEIKKQIDKAKNQVKHWKKKMDFTGENHSMNAKT